MQVSVETTSGIERRMTIGVPAQQVEQAVQARLQETSRSARMNGFRPGKVPMSVVKRRFGAGVRQEVIGEIMRDAYVRALDSEKLTPAGYPRFEPKSLAEGKDLEFVAVFEVLPELDVTGIEAIEVETPVSEITDKDLETMIDTLRRQQATLKSVKRKSKKKDILTIAFKGFVDGEAFEGGSAENYRLALGGGQMIPGFEDGLVGAKAGEEVRLELTFPADYHNKDLAGKAATFEVTVKDVEEPVLPELDADFFTKFGLENTDEDGFRAEVRSNMERELKQALNGKIKNIVVDAMLAKLEFPVPNALVEQEIDRLREDAVRQFGGQMQPQQLPAELFKDQAVRRVRTGLMFQEMLRKHDIKVDAARVDEKLKDIASTYQEPEEVIAWYNANPQQKAQIEAVVLEDQLVEYVLGQAKVKEKKVKYEDAVRPAGQQGGAAAESDA